MSLVAAAPHLSDDALTASPELALVDLDLAAKLRADIRAGEAFRPREVARPEFRLLLPDVDSADVESGQSPVAEELRLDAVTAEEIVARVEPVVVALESPAPPPAVDELSDLPDYVVLPEEAADEAVLGARLAEDPAESYPTFPAFLDVVPEAPAADDGSHLPDYVVLSDSEIRTDAASAVDEASERSDYPVLPDLGEVSEILEESDAALRKIREQIGSDPSERRRHLRRVFTVASGLAAVAAVALFAVDVELGVVAPPGWLGF